jgi:NAD(P)-dependent dehydrogenase (short-subunit alcohol dehydrogenase family)
MSARLEGKVAIITGAAAGQGRATAVRFAREGASLGITDVDERGLRETADQVRAEEGEVVSVPGDASDVAHVDALVSAVVARFGRVDILHNNAGILGEPTPVAELGEDEWDRVMRVNAKSQFLFIRRVVPEMRKAGGGSIINVSSIGAVRGFSNLAAYCASKGAAMALTPALALELGPDNIRVNTLVPGSIDTGMPRAYLASFPEDERPPLEAAWSRHIIKRFGSPEEIASAVLFLASDESSFSTGLMLHVDGGWLAW